MLTVPRMKKGSVQILTFGRKRRESGAFDDFPPGSEVDCIVTFERADRAVRQGSVPGGGEQGIRRTSAKAISALPAHAGGARGLGHAAGAGERVEKSELAGRGPTVSAEA